MKDEFDKLVADERDCLRADVERQDRERQRLEAAGVARLASLDEARGVVRQFCQDLSATHCTIFVTETSTGNGVHYTVSVKSVLGLPSTSCTIFESRISVEEPVGPADLGVAVGEKSRFANVDSLKKHLREVLLAAIAAKVARDLTDAEEKEPLCPRCAGNGKSSRGAGMCLACNGSGTLIVPVRNAQVGQPPPHPNAPNYDDYMFDAAMALQLDREHIEALAESSKYDKQQRIQLRIAARHARPRTLG